MSKKPLAARTAADFAHLDFRPMSAEVRAAFKQACSPGGIQYEPEEPRAQDGHQFDHLNGPEFVAEQAKAKADAIIAAGEARRNRATATTPAGVAGKIIAAAAKRDAPTSAPEPTDSLARRILSAARRAVRL